MITIVSWNVNGIRAVAQKGMFTWLRETSPDILCVQETKAQPEQLPAEILAPNGYTALWESAQKRGYSGVAAFVKKAPLSVANLGDDRFDCEGRVQILEYEHFFLINTYFPNSQEGGARLSYKIAFCDALLAKCQSLRAQKKNVIICGDFNIAHSPIDLANPKSNEKNPGYLPEERAWMSEFLDCNYADTFRLFTKEGGHYTWWSYRFNARQKDIGWRIDYHCVNKEFVPRVKKSVILKDVPGSDHCPVEICIE